MIHLTKYGLRLLQPAALNRYGIALSDEYNTLLDELTAAGRGHELQSDTRIGSDELSIRCQNNFNAGRDLSDECGHRMRYHGSLRRTATVL